MELEYCDKYYDESDSDNEDIIKQTFFNDSDLDNTDTDFENTYEFKQLKKAWKTLTTSTTFDSEYWSHIAEASQEVRGVVRRLSIEDRIDKTICLLKIIERKAPMCPEDKIFPLQCLLKTFIPFTNVFERATQANILNLISKIDDNLEQLKMKSIEHLLQLLKDKDATIANLEQQIELFKANSTSESTGPSTATLNLSLFGELETLRRVDNVNKDTALLFTCSLCKQNLTKSLFTNSQLKQRVNRKCKKCTAATLKNFLSDASLSPSNIS